jgi:hypothetical protein
MAANKKSALSKQQTRKIAMMLQGTAQRGEGADQS